MALSDEAQPAVLVPEWRKDSAQGFIPTDTPGRYVIVPEELLIVARQFIAGDKITGLLSEVPPGQRPVLVPNNPYLRAIMNGT
jgi:hypothetical protein